MAIPPRAILQRSPRTRRSIRELAHLSLPDLEVLSGDVAVRRYPALGTFTFIGEVESDAAPWASVRVRGQRAARHAGVATIVDARRATAASTYNATASALI